jgi:hypothetical protein
MLGFAIFTSILWNSGGTLLWRIGKAQDARKAAERAIAKVDDDLAHASRYQNRLIGKE